MDLPVEGPEKKRTGNGRNHHKNEEKGAVFDIVVDQDDSHGQKGGQVFHNVSEIGNQKIFDDGRISGNALHQCTDRVLLNPRKGKILYLRENLFPQFQNGLTADAGGKAGAQRRKQTRTTVQASRDSTKSR